MKKLFTLTLIMLSYASIGRSEVLDHNDPNPEGVARAAYYLADQAEYLQRISYYYRNISYAAGNLHMEASDVYHVARQLCGGGFGPHGVILDHDEGRDHRRLQEEFMQTSYAYRRLQNEFQYTYVNDYRIQQTWSQVQNAYYQLSYAMGGVDRDLDPE